MDYYKLIRMFISIIIGYLLGLFFSNKCMNNIKVIMN